MAENICQTDDIFFKAIKRSGKQMTQVVGEDLAFRHTGLPPQPLHSVPNVGSVQGLARRRAEKITLLNAAAPGVTRQRAAQLFGQDHSVAELVDCVLLVGRPHLWHLYPFDAFPCQ